MQILDSMILVFFALFMIVMIIGFNKQIQEKIKQREEKQKRRKNE